MLGATSAGLTAASSSGFAVTPGAAAPTGPVLAAHVADVGVKDALVADNPVVYFTTSHFDGYPAVLIQLALIDKSELKEVLVDGWLARAPKRLARQYLDASG